jgi:hypothetical protein
MGTGQAIALAVVGVATGAFGCWWMTGSYYTNEPAAREKELWKRIAELEAMLKVPPMFWQVWARYTHELPQGDSNEQSRGKHATTNAPVQDDSAADEACGREGQDRS